MEKSERKCGKMKEGKKKKELKESALWKEGKGNPKENLKISRKKYKLRI